MSSNENAIDESEEESEMLRAAREEISMLQNTLHGLVSSVIEDTETTAKLLGESSLFMQST